MATCTTSAVATNLISLEKSERIANELILVRRAQRGDEEAVAALFQLHSKVGLLSLCVDDKRRC